MGAHDPIIFICFAHLKPVTALVKMMQSLGRMHVGYFNHTYKRTGTLREGRYKSSIVQSERYLPSVYRYIELNPVRAGMVVIPFIKTNDTKSTNYCPF